MPWIDNLLWDAAIEADRHIAIGHRPSEPRGCEGREVLYRPGELLVEHELWDADGHPLREAFAARRGAARPVARAAAATRSGPPRRHRLGLQLLYTRRSDPLGLLRDAQRQDFGDLEAASSTRSHRRRPQRHGGDSAPDRAGDLAEVVQSSRLRDAGQGVRIGVLDTGIVERAARHAEHRGARSGGSGDRRHVPAGALRRRGGAWDAGRGRHRPYAPGAKLVVRRVLDTPGGVADETEIAQALLGPRPAQPADRERVVQRVRRRRRRAMLAFERAVQHVQANGTLLVAASATRASTAPRSWRRSTAWRASPRSRGRQHQLATYSNRGTT